MTDTTPLQHAAVALVLQLITWRLTGDAWLGAALAVALFAGREHAQAEHRHIQRTGGTRAATALPWLGALRPAVWRVGDVLDLLVPAVAVTALAAAIHLP